MDSGAGQHLCSENALPPALMREVTPCDGIQLSTANGVIPARGQLKLSFLGTEGTFLLLDNTPPVLSVGRLVEDHSFAFHWKKGHAWLETPSGKKVTCSVRGYVPLLNARALDCRRAEASQNEHDLAYPVDTVEPPEGTGTSVVGSQDCFNDCMNVQCSVHLPAAPNINAGNGGADEEAAQEAANPEGVVQEAANPEEAPVEAANPEDGPQQAHDGHGEEAEGGDPLSREERLKADANSLAHQLCHIPLNAHCPVCQEAKAKAKPARRREPTIEDVPSKWGECLLADAFNLRELSVSLEGEKYGLVLKDLGTGLMQVYALRRKSRVMVVCAIREFAGPRTQFLTLASDNAKELIAAAKFEHMLLLPSTPWRPTSNTRIERVMQLVGDGIRVLLLQAGLPPSWWPYAAQAFSMARNIETPADGSASAWMLKHEAAFEGKRIPFGAEVVFRLPPPYRSGGKFGPRGARGIFLGWHMQPGMTFKGDYQVAPVDDLLDTTGQKVRVMRVKEIKLLPGGPPSFPLRQARLEARGDRLRERVERDLDDIVAVEPVADEYDANGNPRAGKPVGGNDPLPVAPPLAPPPMQAIEDQVPAPDQDPEDLAIEDGDISDGDDDVADDDDDDLAQDGDGPSSSTGPAPRARRLPGKFPVQPKSPPKIINSDLNDEVVIDFDAVNPKRPGSKAYELYEQYKSAKTVGEALRLGASKGHIRYDVNKRFARIQAMLCVMLICAATSSAPLADVWAMNARPADGRAGLWDGREVHHFTCDRELSEGPTAQAALKLVRRHAGTHVHASLPSSPWSSWQQLNLKKGSVAQRKRIEQSREQSMASVKAFTRLAKAAVARGGCVTFEWPKDSLGWKQPMVCKMIEELQLTPVDMQSSSKEWRIMCSSGAIGAALRQRQPAGLREALSQGMQAHEDAMNVGEVVTPAMSAECHHCVDSVPAYTCDMFADAPQVHHVVCMDLTLRPQHRPRNRQYKFGMWSGLVTRIIPAGSPEFRSEFCQKALLKEKGTLENATVWDISTVREWSDVRNDGSESLVGRVFAIMGEKGSERGIQNPADRTYKARVVFAGNNVQSASGTAPHELYQEISQTPAAMNTVRAALALAALRGYVPKVRDAAQAFIQASIYDPGKRPNTWVRLPKSWWPASWSHMRDPVVLLKRALYGHPESGALWDRHLKAILSKLGWQAVESHPGMFVHQTNAILVVYVDDLLMAAPAEEEDRLWSQIEAHVGFGGPAEPISKFLGGHHEVKSRNGVCEVKTNMRDFIVDAVEKYKQEIGVTKLPAVRSPFLDEDFIPKGQDAPGMMAASCSSHLMKLLFAARLARPDILVPITRLASKVSCWQLCHDRHLHRLMSYLAHHADLELRGSLSTADLDTCVLVMSVDADLAGDMETAKSTSGMYLELRSADDQRCWPLSWRSKRQGSTASSTCEAEYIALATCLKAEALPMLDLLSTALRREVHLNAREDNTQCLAAVKNGYSAALRHLPRTERISLSVCHEVFIENEDKHSLVYEPTESHKGDVFTKRLGPAQFERAIRMLGLHKMSASA